MNILTIDPGKRITGYCIQALDGDHPDITDYISTKKLKTEIEIINHIGQQIKNILQMYYIDLVVIEDYPYGMQSSRLLYIAEIKGVIKAACAYLKKRYVILPIETWKKYRDTKYNKMKKDKAYVELFNADNGQRFEVPDQVDAYCMMQTTIAIIGGDIRTEAAQKYRDKIREIIGI